MTPQGIPPEQEPIILSRACPPNCLENAKIAERKRIGAWLDSHVCGVIRLDGMPSGMAFADIVTDLKAGKLPGGD